MSCSLHAAAAAWCCCLVLLLLVVALCVCTGAEQLKQKLSQLGLKCGGTVQQRAQRLYAIKGRR